MPLLRQEHIDGIRQLIHPTPLPEPQPGSQPSQREFVNAVRFTQYPPSSIITFLAFERFIAFRTKRNPLGLMEQPGRYDPAKPVNVASETQGFNPTEEVNEAFLEHAHRAVTLVTKSFRIAILQEIQAIRSSTGESTQIAQNALNQLEYSLSPGETLDDERKGQLLAQQLIHNRGMGTADHIMHVLVDALPVAFSASVGRNIMVGEYWQIFENSFRGIAKAMFENVTHLGPMVDFLIRHQHDSAIAQQCVKFNDQGQQPFVYFDLDVIRRLAEEEYARLREESIEFRLAHPRPIEVFSDTFTCPASIPTRTFEELPDTSHHASFEQINDNFSNVAEGYFRAIADTMRTITTERQRIRRWLWQLRAS